METMDQAWSTLEERLGLAKKTADDSDEALRLAREKIDRLGREKAETDKELARLRALQSS